MENLLTKYYKALAVLKTQQKNMHTIYSLHDCLINYNRAQAIKTLSKVLFKYSKQINIIANLLNTPHINTFENVDVVEEYNKEKKLDENILYDIEYTIDCLIMIFAVDAGFASSLNEIANKLKNSIY